MNTAQEIYRQLIEDDKILQVEGRISFQLAQVEIVVKQRDVVGNIIQEWLAGWMSQHHIPFRLGENSQMPPDFYLNPESDTDHLLEVKAFNRESSPAFDLADFKAYQKEIQSKPYMLHVDYLIFGYEMTSDGRVIIRDLWLKKIWQITRRMKDWPLNLQIKQGVVHKIRPCTWYSQQIRDFAPFARLEDLISAIEQTVYQNPDTRHLSGTWLTSFLDSYRAHYGVKLSIPRWSEISERFIVSKRKEG